MKPQLSLPLTVRPASAQLNTQLLSQFAPGSEHFALLTVSGCGTMTWNSSLNTSPFSRSLTAAAPLFFR